MEGLSMPVFQGFSGIPDVTAHLRASGTYLCLPCDVQFEFSSGHTACPSCSSGTREDITALYIEHDAEQAEFMAAFDFGEGD
jgi:hypothetical protein